MDIESYMSDVRARLSAAANRREEIRSATLGPLGPIQHQITDTAEKLRQIRDDIRSRKAQSLHDLTDQAKQRRAEASAEAARILDEADRRAKEVRRSAKESIENERARVCGEYEELLREQTRDLEEEIASLRERESAALSDLGGPLADADSEYRTEYDKVVSERIITRKALESMGFAAPPLRHKQLDGAGSEQEVH